MHQEDEAPLIEQDGAEMDAAPLEHEVSEAFQAHHTSYTPPTTSKRWTGGNPTKSNGNSCTTEAREYYVKSVSFT